MRLARTVPVREPNSIRAVVAAAGSRHGTSQTHESQERKKGRSAKAALERSAPEAVSLSRLSEDARTGIDYRGVRRRSVRHWNLQPGRRTTRLRHRLGH